MERIRKFFEKHLGAVVLTSALALGLTVIVQRQSVASQSNPVQANTDYRRNANYVQVYNADDVAHEAGSVCIYVLPATATWDGVEVSTTASASSAYVAGVVPYGETLKAHSWGRLQTYGYHPAVKIAVANSAAAELITSTTGEKAGVYANGAEHGIVFGTAMEAQTSSTTVKALLKIE